MHDIFMREAVALAREAEAAGEVPVGAVVVVAGDARGRQPIAVADQADGVGVEVVGAAFILFADHVQMALQRGHDGLFAAGSGGGAEYYVVGGAHRSRSSPYD